MSSFFGSRLKSNKEMLNGRIGMPIESPSVPDNKNTQNVNKFKYLQIYGGGGDHCLPQSQLLNVKTLAAVSVLLLTFARD